MIIATIIMSVIPGAVIRAIASALYSKVATLPVRVIKIVKNRMNSRIILEIRWFRQMISKPKEMLPAVTPPEKLLVAAMGFVLIFWFVRVTRP